MATRIPGRVPALEVDADGAAWMRVSIVNSFWAKTTKLSGGHRIWIGGGGFRMDKTTMTPIRVAYMIVHGMLPPKGWSAAPGCKVRGCVAHPTCYSKSEHTKNHKPWTKKKAG